MRRAAVLAALLLAFAAGWLLRGCAEEPGARNDAGPLQAKDATASTPRPVSRERKTSRVLSGPEPELPGARTKDGAKLADGDPAPPDPPKPPVAEAAPGDEKPLSSFAGLVVDAATGAGVEGVTVHLCVSREDGEFGGWMGETTDADGRFKCDLLPDWVDARNRFEVRAGRDGYRTARVAVTTGSVRVEIEKLDRAQRPGRIAGTALGEDGKPLTGRLFIGVHDELHLHSAGVWANADANGRFAIDGVAPGHWIVALSESRESVEVNVSEDGESAVELRGRFEGATGAFAAGDLTEAAFTREKSRLDAVMWSAVRAKGGGDDAWDDPEVRGAGYALQQLEYQWLRYAPGRDVVVTGAPDDPVAFVRLDRQEGGCCEWRAAIADGTARFPSIPLGKWRAVLVRPGVPEVGVDVDVVKGDGAFDVALDVPK